LHDDKGRKFLAFYPLPNLPRARWRGFLSLLVCIGNIKRVYAILLGILI
jgi:hypothetical protein